MFEKNNKIVIEQVLDGVEAMTDNKISNAEDRIEQKAQKRHSTVMNTLDSFVGEKKTSEQERSIQSEQIIRNTKRIEKLEAQVFS